MAQRQTRWSATNASEFVANNALRALLLAPKKLWHLYRTDAEGIFWNEAGTMSDLSALSRNTFRVINIVAQLYYLSILGLGVFQSRRAKQPSPPSRVDPWNVDSRPPVRYVLGVFWTDPFSLPDDAVDYDVFSIRVGAYSAPWEYCQSTR